MIIKLVKIIADFKYVYGISNFRFLSVKLDFEE